ncbi:MAG: lysophospholipid acyltransferase family protein [Planctomycetota bacterium]
MSRHTALEHIRRTFYCLCRCISGTAVTCLSWPRHFNVPDLQQYGGVVLAANHQSFLDPVLIGMTLERPIHYLARASLFQPPGFGPLIRALGAYPLRRGQADGAALRQALKIIRREEALLLFPEGTRSTDGTLAPMQPGAAMLAARCDVPLLPVCIEGAFRAWPRTAILPRPAPVAVQFGSPIHRGEGGIDQMNENLTRTIQDMQQELRQYLHTVRR